MAGTGRKLRGDGSQMTPSPYDHVLGGWGSVDNLVIGPCTFAPTNGAQYYRTDQLLTAGTSLVIPYPYFWIYDILIGMDQFKTGASPSTDSAVFDVVVTGKAATQVFTGGHGSNGYANTAGDPNKNPITDFASVLTSTVSVLGAQPSLIPGVANDAALTASKYYQPIFFSARMAAAPIIQPAADPFLAQGINPYLWASPDYTGAAGQTVFNLKNQTGETLPPVLRQGQHIQLRYKTAGTATNNVTYNGLYVIVTGAASDTPFDFE